MVLMRHKTIVGSARNFGVLDIYQTPNQVANCYGETDSYKHFSSQLVVTSFIAITFVNPVDTSIIVGSNWTGSFKADTRTSIAFAIIADKLHSF